MLVRRRPLARRLYQLSEYRPSLPASSNHRAMTTSAGAALDRYKLVFFCPPLALPDIKTAIFAAGAGRYPGPGAYSECCFTTPGIGQFRPGESANPHIGERGKVEEVGEVRCETLCVGRDVTQAAVEALKKAHPYEEPAYEVYKLEDF